MMQRQRVFALVGFFTLLFIVDWFLYFRHATHFFQADTIFLLNHRASSVAGYLKEFVALNPSGWYRPLANELIESILFPVAGLDPTPYRIPVYVIFFAISVGVYALTLQLTRRHIAAGIATAFFSIHTTNAYTTYDIGFMPELLYTFFFLGATLAYLRYVQSENKRAYILSILCVAGSLFSKEAAVMLPAALFATGFLFSSSSSSFRDRLIWSARSVTPHVLVCVAYFTFAVGYLNVMDLSPSKLFNTTRIPAPGDYIPVFNRGVLKNADLAVSWAFNIPRGWWGQWQRPNPGMVGYLGFFRVLVLVLGVAALFRPGRAVVALGFLWFWITIFPALPLVAHFLPYYLFLPVVGLSLIVGTAFVGLFDMLSRLHTSVAAAVITLLIGGVLYVTSRTIRNDIADNHLLGGSAKVALSTLNDLRRFYPELPPGATLYFADGQESVAWEHDSGGLVKMSYGLDTISARYQSQGEPMPFGDQKALVFKVRGGRLFDETAKYRDDPFKFIKVINSDLKLELSASDVTAGDHYTLRINGVSKAPARFAYTVDDGPLESFTALLDGEGKAIFNVSQQTRRGVYRFEAFNVTATDEWIRSGETLRVR